MARARFSEVLADRRRQLGLSIGQAAQVLRLRPDVLEAFESGDFASMPKSGYAQGMLSSYARYLDLDPEAMVDMFTSELEEYRRGGRSSRRFSENGSSSRSRDQQDRTGSQGYGAQGYEGRRGLLPTSGGPAGDLGSFATTSSVRRRDSGQTGYSASYGSYNRTGSQYPQGRPYTSHAPYDARVRDRRQASARRNAIRRGERAYGTYDAGRDYGDYDSDNITTMSVDDTEYQDDLGFGNEARPYRAASTAAGRPRTRDIAPAGRPNVRRKQQSASSQRRARPVRRAHAKRGRFDSLSEFFSDPLHAFVTIAIGVVLVLTIVIIGSVSSCVSTAVGTDTKSVPVSTATSSDSSSNDSSSSTSSTDDEAAREALAQVDAQSGSDDQNTETDVTVSVADGAVTWLEITCDGVSEVADTVTGAWENTYVVTDSITIETGDTTAVTVTKNGKQVQFESLASGVGSVTIPGTKVTSTDSNSSAAEGSTTSSNTTGTTGSTTSGTSGTSGSASGTTSSGTGASTTGSGSVTSGTSGSTTSGTTSGSGTSSSSSSKGTTTSSNASGSGTTSTSSTKSSKTS